VLRIVSREDLRVEKREPVLERSETVFCGQSEANEHPRSLTPCHDLYVYSALYEDLPNTHERLRSILRVRLEVFMAVTMMNAVFWDIRTHFVPHRRHITSPLQSLAS
jgi:hypothetical protein